MQPQDHIRKLLEAFELPDDSDSDSAPARIPTSVGKITLRNPYVYANEQNRESDIKKWFNLYSGNPRTYQFISKIQDENHRKIEQVLRLAGLRLNHLYAATFHGNGGAWNRGTKANLEHFIAIAGSPESPSFIWVKTEGKGAGSGSNSVYFAGIKMNTSEFIQKASTPKTLEKLIHLLEVASSEGINVSADATWEVELGLFKSSPKFTYRKVRLKVVAQDANKAKTIGLKRYLASPAGIKAQQDGFDVRESHRTPTRINV